MGLVRNMVLEVLTKEEESTYQRSSSIQAIESYTIHRICLTYQNCGSKKKEAPVCKERSKSGTIAMKEWRIRNSLNEGRTSLYNAQRCFGLGLEPRAAGWRQCGCRDRMSRAVCRDSQYVERLLSRLMGQQPAVCIKAARVATRLICSSPQQSSSCNSSHSVPAIESVNVHLKLRDVVCRHFLPTHRRVLLPWNLFSTYLKTLLVI